MATKANMAAQAAVKDAERRAKRKLARLNKNGVRTGSISPFHSVDTTDTWALKRYAKELNTFVSRKTRYVAGYDGTPIPYQVYRDFRNTEKAWQKAHAKYWGKFANEPFITASGAQDTTQAMRSAMHKISGIPFGDITEIRHADVAQLRGVPDIKKRMQIMKREMSASYQEKRLKQLRKNMIEAASAINEPSVVTAIRGLTTQQLFQLQNFANFVPVFYEYFVDTDPMSSLGDVADAFNHEGTREHLLETIKHIKKMYPRKPKTVTMGNKSKDVKRKNRKRGKRR